MRKSREIAKATLENVTDALSLLVRQLEAAPLEDIASRDAPIERLIGEFLFLTNLEFAPDPARVSLLGDTLRHRRQQLELLLTSAALAADVSGGVLASSVGAAWTLCHLADEFGPRAASAAERVRNEVAGALRPWLKSAPAFGHFDIISGLAGITPFVVRYGDRELMDALTDRFFDLAEVTPDGVLWPTAPEYIIEESMGDPFVPSYNYGMAHGVFGVLVSLSNLFTATASGRVRALLDGTLRAVFMQEAGAAAELSGFPRRVSSGDSQSEQTRLAWCYGDLSASVALLLSARALGDSLLAETATRIGRATVSRGLEQSGVVDAGFCHGASGVAHLYDRLHQYTQDDEFGIAAAGWYDVAAGFVCSEQGLRVVKFGERRVVDFGLIMGVAGVGLTLLGALRDAEPCWDSLLGLSLSSPSRASSKVQDRGRSGLRAHASFLVRSPVHSFTRYTTLVGEQVDSEDAAHEFTTRVLQHAAADPVLREALWLADRSLYSQIFEGSSTDKALRALTHYLLRSSTRCTPFGLFSGCSIGSVGEDTRLDFADSGRIERTVRPSMRWLHRIIQALASDWSVVRKARVFANPTIKRLGEFIYYMCRPGLTSGRGNHERRLRASPGVEQILDLCGGGVVVSVLQKSLQLDDEASRHIISRMLAAELLYSEIEPSLTGGDAAAQVARLSRGADAAAVCAARHVVFDDEADIDSRIEWYARFGDEIGAALNFDEGCRDFHVDFSRESGRFSLSSKTVDNLLEAIELLEDATPRRARIPIELFADQFESRYGEGPVPLLDAVSARFGIGYPVKMDIEQHDGAGAMTGPPAYAYNKWLRGSLDPKATVHLARTELESLQEKDRPGVARLPSMIALCKVFQTADGADLVVFDGAVGPSAATLLTRFHALSERYGALVRELSGEDDGAQGAPLYAEVIQWPDVSSWDVIQRPSQRAFEIPVLGRSSVDSAHQLSLSDLYLQIVGGRLVLFSRRLQRAVVPTLTSAHNYLELGIGDVYRFLCDLVSLYQRTAVRWNWGGEPALSFHPRVQFKNIIISCAQWRLNTRDCLDMVAAKSVEQFSALLRGWCEGLAVPRYVVMENDGADLFIDMRNIYCVRSLWAKLRSAGSVLLTEAFPSEARPALRDEKGDFLNEVLIPIRRADGRGRLHAVAPRSGGTQRFLPGSEWLYIKVYGGCESIDVFLIQYFRAEIFRLRASGHVKRWFFVRYDDPIHHCRLRLEGDQQIMRNEVLPALMDFLERMVATGVIESFGLDTYLPEEMRYGGRECMDLCETIFCVDSEAIVDLLSTGGVSEHGRLVTATYLADSIMRAFALGVHARMSLMASIRDSYLARSETSRHELKRLRSTLREAVSEQLWHGQERLGEAEREREAVMTRVGYKIRDLHRNGELTSSLSGIVLSVVHMSINRCFATNTESAENQAYDLLWAAYRDEFFRALYSAR